LARTWFWTLGPLILAGGALAGETGEAKTPTVEELAADVSMLKKLNPWSKVVSAVKAKADLRLRHESQWLDRNTDDYERHRERIRLRAGFDLSLPHHFTLGLRLATGNTTDPISTNQSFGEALANKSINLDQGYVAWNPLSDGVDLTLYGGRFRNFFFHHQTMFDGDTNFDGLGQELSIEACEGFTFFANAAESPIKELSSDEQDPWLFAFQGGVQARSGVVGGRAAAGMWLFNGLEGAMPSQIYSTSFRPSSRYNSLNAAGEYERNYDVFHVLGEVAVAAIEVVPIAVIGEYYRNTETSHQDQGYMFGGRVGKSKKAGDIYGGYEYRWIEADATYDVFPDSDFHEGGTNTKGHVFKIGGFFADSLSGQVTLFLTKKEDNGTPRSKAGENRLQLDLIFTI